MTQSTRIAICLRSAKWYGRFLERPDYAIPYYQQILQLDPAHHAALTREVRTVAEEIAADPKYATDEPMGPDDDARARFREFAKKQLG